MAESPYIRVEDTSRESLWVVFFTLFFFVLINVGVWLTFERSFFDRVGFDRLLMHPSDNELQSIIDKMRSDDRRHVVLLGDSVVWGVGVNDPKETIAGNLESILRARPDIRVVNLAVPGNSFLDQLAVIEALSDPDDIYLFFINTLLFDEEYANRSFEESVRFKTIVRRELGNERDHGPGQIIPLMHNRDIITKTLIGLQPSIVIDALLHRLMNFRFFDVFRRMPMNVGGGKTVARNPPDFSQSRMTGLLREVAEVIRDRPNIFTIILDDNRYGDNPEYLQSTRLIEKIMGQERTLNLVGSVPKNLYLDTAHMTPDGHVLTADRIVRFLARYDAP